MVRNIDNERAHFLRVIKPRPRMMPITLQIVPVRVKYHTGTCRGRVLKKDRERRAVTTRRIFNDVKINTTAIRRVTAKGRWDDFRTI